MTREPGKVRFEVVRGVEGLALYVNNRRVAGPKPWGGGDPVVVWLIAPEELRDALGLQTRRCDACGRFARLVVVPAPREGR
jgi:hypothetical protein